MLNNLKLGVRLGLGFGLVLILLIVIAYLGITRLATMNDSIEKIVNDRWPKTVAANDIIDLVNSNARAIRNVMLVVDPADKKREADRVVENRKKIGERFDWLDKNINTEDGKKLLEVMKSTRAAYVPVTNQVLELALADKREDAVKLMLGEMRKLQGAYIDEIGRASCRERV